MYALKSVGSTGPRRLLAASHSRDSSSCWLSPITCKSVPLFCDALDHVAEPVPGERLGAMRVGHAQDPASSQAGVQRLWHPNDEGSKSGN